MMYEVDIHHRVAKPYGVEFDHHWVKITRRPLGLAKAKALADLQPYHAIVTPWRSSEQYYDNGKPPCPTAPDVSPAPVQAPGTRRVVREKLPLIIRFLETLDGGEGGQSECPHCGAQGRWIHRFVTEDGRTLGAMSGCIKLFPVSPIAAEQHRLAEKEREYKKVGWELNRFDKGILQVIDLFYAGTLTEDQAKVEIRRHKAIATAWRKSRGAR